MSDTDKVWLEFALHCACHSPDPSTQAGAVIVSRGHLCGAGWNEFPAGMEHTEDRLHNKDTKLEAIVHAEMNAICGAARQGKSTDGATLYIAATDNSGIVYGGPPCTGCTKHVAQAGIKRIVSFKQKGFSKWWADLCKARTWLAEIGIELVEVDPISGEAVEAA